MGCKFVHPPLKVNESEPTKRYTFCHSFRGMPVRRFITNQADDQGKLDLIRIYLLAISDAGVPIRRLICKPHCKRECASKSGMFPTISNIDTFLKLSDYESTLWSICCYKIENNLSTYHIDEVLEQLECQSDEFEFLSETQEDVETSYNYRDHMDFNQDHGMVHQIHDRHFINSIYDIVSWPDAI